MEKNLTTGSVLKSILYFSLPYLLSYFLQTLYGMADLFIIGQFEDISEYNGSIYRQPGNANVNGNDRWSCYGSNG